jgi:hypothetical protein
LNFGLQLLKLLALLALELNFQKAQFDTHFAGSFAEDLNLAVLENCFEFL